MSEIVHAVLEERAVVGDPEWDTLSVVSSVTTAMADLTAFRYPHTGPGRPTPLPATDVARFRELNEATAAPNGARWDTCVIKIERDRGKVAVDFLYGEEADELRVTPATLGEVMERLRPRPSDFDG